MITLTKRVIATVCYADIFDYPLTVEELRVWLIGNPGNPSLDIPGIVIKATRNDTYVHLRKRQAIMRTRKRRHTISREKWQLARSFARFFTLIPTVRLVGVTGGLSMNNADRLDDIDLFFITSPGTLWATRGLVTLLSDILGIRRKTGDRQFTDKICLNMFMAEDAVTLPLRERDLFSAHEVLQLKILWSRGNTYQEFLKRNAWVKRFLPGGWNSVTANSVTSPHARPHMFAWFLTPFLRLMEPYVFRYQLRYMQPRRTTEVIRPGFIRFHPNDARIWIQKKLAKRIRQFNIPLDRIFYRP